MRNNKIMLTKYKILLLPVIIAMFFVSLTLGFIFNIKGNASAVSSNETLVSAKSDDEGYIYLSDLPYVESKSYSTYDPLYNTGRNIVIDGCAVPGTTDGLITLATGAYDDMYFSINKTFYKGLTACAPSEVVYDVSGLGYDYFSTYYGVDSKMAYVEFLLGAPEGSGQANFYFYTSIDGENWELEFESDTMTALSVYGFVEIDIKGKNYIKLKADAAVPGSQANHAAYGSPRLYNEGFEIDDSDYDFIKTVAEYDEILKACSYEELITTNELVLLQRDFVNFFTYEKLQVFAHIDNNHKETIEWILSDLESLRYYIVGGTPGNDKSTSDVAIRTNALNVLNDLYQAHGDDMLLTTPTEYTTLGDLYRRMIITTALEFASPIKFTILGGSYEQEDPVERYEIFKKLHANGYLDNAVFENLTVPQMRLVLGSTLDNEEIEWLNWYVRVKMQNNRNCFAYVPYGGPSYMQAKFYSTANYNTWNERFNLSEFNITYGNKKYPKLWMMYVQGAWCGGISQNGQYINQVLGIPAQMMSQPTHSAYLFMMRNNDGQCYWGSAYDLYGWSYSSGTEFEMLLLKWGSRTWNVQISGNTSDYHRYLSGGITYVLYAQSVLNDYENYVKAEETRILADVYTKYPSSSSVAETYTATGTNSENAAKLKEIYEKVLEYSPLHLYGWYGLINAYKEDLNSTPEDFANLAKRISETMYVHPYPMYELLNLLDSKLAGTAYYASFLNSKKQGIESAYVLGTQIPTDYLQPGASRTVAARMLGYTSNDYVVATFSFDGANAGKIVLGSNFYNSGLLWDYSLDGGNTWTQTLEPSVALTSEQIASINAEDDILVHFIGVSYSEESIYTIDIIESVLPDDTSTAALYGNDLENRVVGVTDLYEWRYSASDAWTSYKTAAPDLTGNKSVEIRIGTHSTYLPSTSRVFTFTQDEQPGNRKYIPVSHLSLHTVSSQATNQSGSALYSMDANYNTRWHSNWNGTDTQRYISFKFDSPIFLSAVEFVPAGGGNGKILDGTVYGSLDGVSWFVLSERKNITYPNQCNDIANAIKYTQSFEIEEPRDVLYVKIVADRASNGNWFTARAFNFYEDTTQEHRPSASIIYSTTEPTTGNVTISLNNLFPSENITITNNDGKDTYTFTENGDFTFYFVNDQGVEGSATAVVTWIDREIPTVNLDFSTETPVRDKVVVILNPNEDITVIRDDIKYRVDEQGNVIDTDVENDPAVEDKTQAILNGYSVDDDLNIIDPLGNVVANINPLRFEYTANGTYTVEYVDKAGNRGSTDIVIDLIDETLPSASLSYDISTPTKENVTVTIHFNEDATLVNNDGKFTYTFKDNGEFEFVFTDSEGLEQSITAVVTWIDRVAPTATVQYDKSSTEKAIVTIVNPSEEITFVEGNGTYEYTANGTYTIEFYDIAGNKGSVEVVVDWLGDDKSYNESDKKPGDTSNNTTMIIVLVCVVVAAVLAGAGVFFVKKKGKKK